MNAVRCRRNLTTLETTPLSPTKYNGLPPALDQLADDIPAYSYEVGVTGRTMLRGEGPRLGQPSSFHDRLITVCPRVGQESTCQSESRDSYDVTARGYFRHDMSVEPLTSQPLSMLAADDVAASVMNGRQACECQSAVAVYENTGHVTHSLDVSCSKSVPSFTDFRRFSSQLVPQPRFDLEMRHEGKSLDKDNLLAVSDNLLINTQDTDYVGFSGRCSLRSAGTLDKSQRNAVASLPVDTFQDPLVTVAMLLVNSAVNVAVRNLVDDVKVDLKPNPVNETDSVPTFSTSNSIQSLPFSDESTLVVDVPVEAAARRLVNQVLSEIVEKSISSAMRGCGQTAASCTPAAAVSHEHSSSSCAACTHCESDSKLQQQTGDNHVVEGCSAAAGSADSAVLMPAAESASDDYLTSVSSVCYPVDQPEMPAARDLVQCVPKNSVYDDFESAASLYSSGRQTFAADSWRPVSPPFTDCSSDYASEVLNNNNVVVVGLFADNVVDPRCQCVDDNLSPYDHSYHISDDDVQARTMCSETADELSANSGNYAYAVKNSVDHDDDSFAAETRQPPKQLASENSLIADTWNSLESSCRPEDYFFQRYVIPVDQLEAGEASLTSDSDPSTDVEDTTTQNEHDQQRTRMQLDLNADDDRNHDIDADIKAVAAFCRAMFTPVESDTDDAVDKSSSSFEVVSSPETLDADELCRRNVRRSISLRTSPGTPHKKKSVRFADALGLDLEYVRQIQTSLDEPPQFTIFPADSDTARFRRPLLAQASAAWHRPRSPARRYLCACFQAPGSHPDFVERVLRSRVVLESCEVDERGLTISGVVRVANVAYHKTVAARVTTDGWATQTDVVAEYVPRSNDGTTDRFAFQIVLPHGATDLGRRVEFAVYFVALFDHENRSETYWDNNFGANYCFECYAHDDGASATLDAETDNDDPFSPWLRFA